VYTLCIFPGLYLDEVETHLRFSEYDIKLNAEGPEKFKPGLPYKAKVRVKIPRQLVKCGVAI